MKSKLLLLAALAFLVMRASAQTGNLIVFTEGGEKFSLVLNAVLQNATPETNVKVTDLPASPDFPTGYKMKIIFADAALGTKDFNTAIDNGIQRTVTIRKNNKGEYVQRMISDVPLAQAPATPATQVVHVYSTTPPPASTTTTSTTISKTTTTTTTGTPAHGENVNINMGVNMGETGGGVNVNVSGMDPNMSGTSQSTTTTTHSTTTSGYNEPPPPPPAPRSYVPGYTGPIGCPVPMGQGDFTDFKNSVSSKSFEESKLTIAKQALNNNCLISSQVKEVMLLFTFEQTRLDFAKYAYSRTHDIGNYFKINDAFTFESSIDDLNNYIGSNR
ncbi:MAG TPA: DUF4476 domain-containing protein [Bacteroidia bacterium]|nr:DUF4476 domain-containing protein [Bacteroidia bacterium]